MPLYEYTCPVDHVFERLVPVSAPEEEKETAECPRCGQIAQRQISLGSFILKGKWFKQGY